MSALKEKTVKGMFWSFSEMLSSQLINLVVQIFLARLLLPEDFGLIGMTTIFIAISQSLIDSGFSSALIRKKDISESDYSTVFMFNLAVSISIYFALFASSTTISVFFKEPRLIPIIRVLSTVIIINSFGIVQRTMLTREIDFKTQTKITIISSAISGVIAILAALVGFGTWALVIRTIVGQVIQSVMLVTHNKWIPTLKFDIKSFKELFGFGWKILVSGLLNTIYENIYYPIIGKFFSATALGFFTNAQKMNDVPSKMLTQAVQKVTYPVLSQVQDDEVTLRNGFGKALRLISFVSFPLMLCLAAVGEPLIKVLVGEKWIPSVQYFQILCFSGMLYPIHSLNLNVLQVKGRSDLFLKLEIIKKIIGVVSIVLVLVLGLGISGLLWAQFVTSIISFFINSFYSKEMINYSMFDQIKDMSPIFLAAILAAGVAYSLMYFLHISDILLLLVQLITGLSTYVIACLLFKIDELHEMRDIYRLLVKP